MVVIELYGSISIITINFSWLYQHCIFAFATCSCLPGDYSLLPHTGTRNSCSWRALMLLVCLDFNLAREANFLMFHLDLLILLPYVDRVGVLIISHIFS